jgi:hypothetical protein
MRFKIILVNAGIVLLVALLTYVLLSSSLRSVLSDPAERKQEAERALRAANAQLALDAFRHERWIEKNANSESVRSVFSLGTPEARQQAALSEANRLRAAAQADPEFERMVPSLVALLDEQGVIVSRDGSDLLRGEKLGDAYPGLAESLKSARAGSAVWINRQRQEQLLASYAPIRGENGATVGAVVVGTPLNDERLSRTSELTSGSMLLFGRVADSGLDIVADSANTNNEVLTMANNSAVVSAAKAAKSSKAVVNVDGVQNGNFFSAVALDGYGANDSVLVAAVPASRVGNLSELLWPILAIGGLGLILVVAGGVLLGNYISQPVSELEDGLLAIINGNSDLRFQLEHEELGGLVFRINSLLNAMMGVPEDTTDEQGRPSTAPSGRDFQEALSVDEGSVSDNADPAVVAALASEAPDQYYKRLYGEYISAKRKLGDPVDHITERAFLERIQGSEREMAQKHGRPVRYQIQLRGNTVVLIAIPMPS